MFDKLKQIKQLRDLQKEIQSQRYESERNGVRVVVSGSMMLEQITLNPSLDIASHERAIKDTVNDALHKAQTEVSKRFAGMMQ